MNHDASCNDASDVLIVGAGPAGLALAAALRGSGLTVTLVEAQAQAALADPPDDGREIALTQRSRTLLEASGIWQRLHATHIVPVREARVFNGADLRPLRVQPRNSAAPLGWMVPNHAIRRAAWQVVQNDAHTRVIAGQRVIAAHTNVATATITLDDGRTLHARLLVLADSRHSATRRLLGIGAYQRDFGRSMLVCRMRLARPQPGQAWEWFDHDQTLALLPLHQDLASVVLTLPQQVASELSTQPVPDFEQAVRARFHDRLGAMQLQGERHTYPLLGVYAQRFSAHRLVLIGDAAVGMHPVTAHGFNLGLAGAAHLAALLRAVPAGGTEIGTASLLARYARAHHARCLPMYLGTQGIVDLYTREHAPARWARHILLQGAARVPGFRQALGAFLADVRLPALPH